MPVHVAATPDKHADRSGSPEHVPGAGASPKAILTISRATVSPGPISDCRVSFLIPCVAAGLCCLPLAASDPRFRLDPHLVRLERGEADNRHGCRGQQIKFHLSTPWRLTRPEGRLQRQLLTNSNRFRCAKARLRGCAGIQACMFLLRIGSASARRFGKNFHGAGVTLRFDLNSHSGPNFVDHARQPAWLSPAR